MKAVALFALVLLVACAQDALQASIPAESPAEESLEVPGSGVPDAVPGAVVQEPPAASDAKGSETTDAAIGPAESPTQAWEREFNERYGLYMYVIEDPRFGDMSVFKFDNMTKYTSPDYLFEIKDGVVVKSNWDNMASADNFKDMLDREDEQVMNYIWYKDGIYNGCYVWVGYYREENCILNNRTGNRSRIVYKDIDFVPPKAPDDWLREFHGKEPIRIRYNYTYKDEGNMLHKVDMVYFDQNGDVAVLYLQQSWKIPVKVEILHDNKVKQTYKYKFVTTDLALIKRLYPFFLND